MPTSAPLVLLDDNETLFDFSPLDPLFEQAFGSVEWRTAWLEATIALALRNTEHGEYHDFPYTGQLALNTLVAERHTVVPADFQDNLTTELGALPLHPDVQEGVAQFHHLGFRVGVLALNPVPFVTGQLRHVRLFNTLDAVLSVDNARQLKPGERGYAYGLREEGAQATSTWMVSVHPWDIGGAKAAGMKGAYLSRKEAWPQGRPVVADVQAHTLTELAPLIAQQATVGA